MGRVQLRGGRGHLKIVEVPDDPFPREFRYRRPAKGVVGMRGEVDIDKPFDLEIDVYEIAYINQYDPVYVIKETVN